VRVGLVVWEPLVALDVIVVSVLHAPHDVPFVEVDCSMRKRLMLDVPAAAPLHDIVTFSVE